MSKEIELTQDKVAIVDDCDYEYLSQFKWHASKDKNTFYARRRTPKINGKRRDIQMHREILDAPPDALIDHRDGNGLNNTRDNLRLSTNQQNQHNQHPRVGGTSRFKGVFWDAGKQKWCAMIHINMKKIWLGSFASELEAARAYDDAARAMYGEFARPNIATEKVTA